MPYYQAPTVKSNLDAVDSSKNLDGTEKKSVLADIKSSFSEMKSKAQEQVDNYMGKSTKNNEQRSTTFKNKADAYEARRRREREALRGETPRGRR